MVYQISWSPDAYRDLVDIHDYSVRHLYASSSPLVGKLLVAVRRLETFPRSGRVVPEWELPDRREIIVRPYRVIYRIVGQQVLITWLLHSRRSLPLHPDRFL